MDTNPMELFRQEAPEVAAAFNNLIMALVASKGRATREEVVDAILLTLTVSGIRGVVHCLPEAVRQYEK